MAASQRMCLSEWFRFTSHPSTAATTQHTDWHNNNGKCIYCVPRLVVSPIPVRQPQHCNGIGFRQDKTKNHISETKIVVVVGNCRYCASTALVPRQYIERVFVENAAISLFCCGLQLIIALHICYHSVLWIVCIGDRYGPQQNCVAIIPELCCMICGYR